jgi:hypothetical protein
MSRIRVHRGGIGLRGLVDSPGVVPGAFFILNPVISLHAKTPSQQFSTPH